MNAHISLSDDITNVSTKWLILILAACTVAFGTLTWLWARALPTHATDSFMYLWQAEQFLKTPGADWISLMAYLPKSLYSILLALAGLAGGHLETAGTMVALASGLITVILTGLSMIVLTDVESMSKPRRLRLVAVAGGLTALHPIFIDYSGRILSESLFTMLTMLAVFFMILFYRSTHPTHLFLCAGAVGLSTLTREVGLAYVPVLAIIPLVGHAARRKRLVLLAGAMLVAVGINLPAMRGDARSSLGQFNMTVHREQFDLLAREQAAFGLDDTARDFAANLTTRVSLPEFISKNLGHFLQRTKANLPTLCVITWRMAGWFLFSLSVAGIGFWIKGGMPPRAGAMTLAFAAITLFVYLPFHLEFRYLVPIIPFLSIFAAFAVDHLLHAAERRRTRPWLMPLLLCVTMGWSYYRTYSIQAAPELNPMNNMTEEKELGTWLRSMIPPGSLIMARKPDVPYYAGGDYIILPFAEWRDITTFTCHRRVDYLVLSQRFQQLRPQLRFLYDSGQVPDNLRLLTDFKAANGIHLYVFKILCPSGEATAPARPEGISARFGL
ncbi:hypothetical protein JW905_01155 [bacterium]|nr:hypothetical protein [candidate division CSSED10-310 bacterium]